MTTQEFLPIEKEYRPSLVIGLVLMTLLVIFMGISLCCLVRYQNIQITELENRIEMTDYALTALAEEVGEKGRDHANRLYELERKHLIEIVNIEDGRIDELWWEVYGVSHGAEYFQSRIDWIQTQVYENYHNIKNNRLDFVRATNQSLYCREEVTENDVIEDTEDCCFRESLQYGMLKNFIFYADCIQLSESPCRRDKIITPGGYYDLITP